MFRGRLGRAWPLGDAMPHKRSKQKKSLRKQLWEMRKELAFLPKLYDPEIRECVSTGYSWNFDVGQVLFGPKGYEDSFLKKIRVLEAIIEDGPKHLQDKKNK